LFFPKLRVLMSLSLAFRAEALWESVAFSFLPAPPGFDSVDHAGLKAFSSWRPGKDASFLLKNLLVYLVVFLSACYDKFALFPSGSPTGVTALTRQFVLASVANIAFFPILESPFPPPFPLHTSYVFFFAERGCFFPDQAVFLSPLVAGFLSLSFSSSFSPRGSQSEHSL